jgi:hypothetical protein
VNQDETIIFIKKRGFFMKKLLIFGLVISFAIVLCVSPSAMAGGKKAKAAPEKEFVCHITEVDCDAEFAYGHVIWVSTNSLKAHCNHGDHYPTGVIRDAQEACAEADDFDKCVREEAIGQDCQRNLAGKQRAVQELCGNDFILLDLCPAEE